MDPWSTSSSDPFAFDARQQQRPGQSQQQHASHQQSSYPPSSSYPYPSQPSTTSTSHDPFDASMYPTFPPTSSVTMPTRGGPPPGVAGPYGGGYSTSSYGATPSYPSTTSSSSWGATTQTYPPPQPQYPASSPFDVFGGSSAQAHPQAQQQASYGGYSQWGSQPPPQQQQRPPQHQQQQPAYAQASVFNPFDFPPEEPSFASSTPKAAGNAQQTPPPKAYQPPTVEQQRLIRTASLLFEHGLVIKTDKTLLQDLVLAGHKKVGPALDLAERSRDTKGLDQILVKARKREDAGKDLGVSSSDDDETDVFAGDATRDGGDGSVYEGGEDFTRRESLLVSGKEMEAPHPMAGGFNAPLPPGMKMEKGCFTGHMLMRVSSKKMFRKWKTVFFVLDKNRLSLYEDRRNWEFHGHPKASFPIHECSWIGRPSLKTSASLIEGGFMEKPRPVYCSWLKENPQSLVGTWTASGMDRPKAFSIALEERILAKFAAYDLVDTSTFAHAVFGVILAKQKAAGATGSSGGGGGGGGGSFSRR